MGVVYLITSLKEKNSYKVDISNTFNLNEIHYKYDNDIMIIHLYQINNNFLLKHLNNHLQNFFKFFEIENGFFKADYLSISKVFFDSIKEIIPARSNEIDESDGSVMKRYETEEIKQYFSDYLEDEAYDGIKKLLHTVITNLDSDHHALKFRIIIRNHLQMFTINTKYSIEKYGGVYWNHIIQKQILETSTVYDLNDPNLIKTLKKYKKKHNNCIINTEIENMLKNNIQTTNYFDIFHNVLSSDCIINGSYYAIINEKKGKDFEILFSIDGNLKHFLMKKQDNIFLIEPFNEATVETNSSIDENNDEVTKS